MNALIAWQKQGGLGLFIMALTGVLFTPLTTRADQVIADDLIVTGSSCVGFDCVNGESFGFDTLRLKENNTRIGFDDTSSTGSFPSNDWQITANDPASGGANKFSIEDITGGKTPFTLTAGAPTNSLFVNSSGNLGLGTSTPAVDLHIVNGNTPAMRLEQDGSSGFSPQTWDVAGNETNFFIRDVTNGSKLPFKIIPGAPDNSLYINSSGKVGLGTSSPSQSLHVRRTDGTAQLLIEEANGTKTARTLLSLKNNGSPTMELVSTEAGGDTWSFLGGSTFAIKNTAGTKVVKLTSTGNMQLTGQLITAGTTCSGGCDIVFNPETTIESIEEHAENMWKNSYLPAVGPTVENAPFNLTQKTGGMLNELEKAHIYIEQLNTRLEKREAQIDQLLSRLEKLEGKP